MKLFITGLSLTLALATPDWLAGTWVGRLLHNPREQTGRGIEAYEAGNVEIAADHFDTALGLAEPDALLQYNAGTASLGAGRPEAVPLLEQSAEAAPEALRPSSYYNLGNARMAAQDPAAAIEAYQETLLSDPSHQQAKHNLELALQLQEQQQEQEQNQEQEQEQDQEQQEQQQPQEQEQEQEQEPDPDSPLPDFEEQPDMTAEQAAAILEAVENLEREQRRKEAQERARESRTGERDW